MRQEQDNNPSCGCGPCGCGSSKTTGVSRRAFMKQAGAGMAAASLAQYLGPLAGPFGAQDVKGGHLVPADKRLDAQWVEALFARGEKEVFTGDALDNIGMPCGGIGAGQLYLRGDGTLGCWMIANDAASNWVDGTNATYEHTRIDSPVDQGFAVASSANGDWAWRTLDKAGFSTVTFEGAYPIGTVRYREEGAHVSVTMEAFSPFIPLNAADSTLPLTLFEITLRNESDAPVEAFVAGWLGNRVAYKHGKQFNAERITRITREGKAGYVSHAARTRPDMADATATAPRETILFEDFESENYGDWTVTGEAFGDSPAEGTLPGQQTVSGFEGRRLVNTFLQGDATTGTLTSPAFTISRRFINVLVGGGAREGKTCINLRVDGEAVRTATGADVELLTWQSWDVAEFEGREARIEIVDDSTEGWGHINVDQIEFADVPRQSGPPSLEEAPDYGTMTLACAEAGADLEPVYPGRDAAQWVTRGESVYEHDEARLGYLRSESVTLAPGAQHTALFALAWHFPNQSPHGHAYARRFASARDVAAYALAEHIRLSGDTHLWRDCFYDSTLPYWLLDRLHSTAANLATGTAQYWGNGRFWAWEGVTCCEGTCTHVWNYAHTHAWLFPELARSIREKQDFALFEEGGGFHPDTGLVGFRSNDAYAADGQCGTILKAYREHRLSEDDAFLKRNWSRIRKALEYAIAQDAAGKTGETSGPVDGLIENTQHNTFDINYEGTNTFVGSLYLAALAAGVAMARAVGDEEFAARAQRICDDGREKSVERLWDGEYFIQDVDLDKYPRHQYGPGCLSDQVFGAGWACQLDLPEVYPKKRVRSALASVWKYNWAPDISPYNEEHTPYRWFISPGQAGLFTCTWPKSEFLPEGTLYRSEVWTGIEYQVAGHMVWEGMLTEGLAICRAVHERYAPALRNPYNEVECGDHYARALASWGVYVALLGLKYHGPEQRIALAPRLSPERFRALFTTAAGWATCDQRRGDEQQQVSLIGRWGAIALRQIELSVPMDWHTMTCNVDHKGKSISAIQSSSPGQLTLKFTEQVNLLPEEEINIIIHKN